jgi:NADH-quinone oxidoreductase subunit G
VVGLPTVLWQQLGLAEGGKVLVAQGQSAVRLPARHDATLDARSVRVAAGHPATQMLGPMFGALTVEKA